MLSTNLGNSGKIMLYLFLTIGLVLGVTAFILVLTKKCEQCKTEGLNFIGPVSKWAEKGVEKQVEKRKNDAKKDACKIGSKSFCSVCIHKPVTPILETYGASREDIKKCKEIHNKVSGNNMHQIAAEYVCVNQVYNKICPIS